MSDYRATVRDAVKNEQRFVRLTLKGKVHGPAVPWIKIVVRPVEIKGGRHWQFSYFDARKDITKNYQGAEGEAKLEEALAIGWSAILLQTTEEELQIQVTKKGKAIIQRIPNAQTAGPELRHNRTKNVPLPSEQARPLLQTIGIANAQGEIRPHMQAKFSQINEFLKLLGHIDELERLPTPLHVVDCGSGLAYLTFATYHYLTQVRGLPTEMTGIEVRGELIEKCERERDQLGYTALHFVPATILEYVPPAPPQIVLALHACDTATDEALAQAIAWDAQIILAVPCCQHDLNDKIQADVFRPVLRHGILQQRLADLLTDSFRAMLLRIMGYRTEVIEFISAEHTAKNVMLRAVKTAAVGEPQFVQEYQALKAFWHVTPHLEKLLVQNGRWMTRTED